MMRLIKKLLLRTLAVLIIILLTQYAVIGVTTYENPLRPPSTNSPRATFVGFMNNMNNAYELIKEAEKMAEKEGGLSHSDAVKAKGKEADLAMDRAIDALNLRDIPPINRQDAGIESALMLKEILDRIELPQKDDIPGEEEVNPSSKLFKPLTRWEVPRSEIAIKLVEEGFNVNEFLFSPETIKRIRQFYQKIEELPYKETNPWKASPSFYKKYITTPGDLLAPKWKKWLPRWTSTLLYGQTLWQWFSLGIITSTALSIVFGIRFLVLRYIKLSHPSKRAWLALIRPSVALCMINFWEYLVNQGINITGQLLLNLLKISTVIRRWNFGLVSFYDIQCYW